MITGLVSVIFPIYNSAVYLEKSLKSILEQSYSKLEVIIVDDGEDDGSLAIIDRFSDKRIKYIKTEHRLGLAESLNYAISVSEGEYIARMDADDISNEERIKKQIEFMDSHQDIGVVGCNAYTMDENDRLIGELVYPENDCEIKKKMLFNNALIHPSVMIRRKALGKLTYDKSCFCCEDYELWSRMMHQTKFHNLPEKLLKYRTFSKSTMQTQLKRMQTDDAYYHKYIGVMKSIYSNVLGYYGIPADTLGENYADFICAKRVSEFSLHEKEAFLEQYRNCIPDTVENIEWGYYWLKLSQKQFFKAQDKKLVCYALEAGIKHLKTKCLIKGKW